MADNSDRPVYSRSDPMISDFRQKRDPGPRSVRDRILNPSGMAPDSFASRLLNRTVDKLTDQSSALMRNVNIDDIRYRLMRAGFPYGMRAQTFVLFKWVMVLVCPFLFLAFFPILAELYGLPLTLLPFFIAIGALYGFKLPELWLSMLTRRRQNDIQMALPDMIDLITVSVEAGLGLGAAIQRVSSRFPNALSEEFLRTMQEVHLGRSQADSLRDMAKRVDVEDLNIFLTSLVQAELLGLAVANVLRVQSERLREKRSQRAREQAQKAPIKMIFPLVFCIFPALFVVILGPAAIAIMSQKNL